MFDRIASAIPAKSRILAAAARLPPALKTRQSCRVLSALARRTQLGRTLSSNMGIAARLRCEVPTDQMLALFGTPALYVGERGSLALAAHLSRFSDAFVDIGAHLGYFSFYVYFRGQAGLPIYCFEPDPGLFRALDANLRTNRLDRVHATQAAIGAKDGSAKFYVNHTDTLSGSLTDYFADRHEVASLDVRVERFATVAARHGFSRACVKVDVENAEFDFLDGADGAFDRMAYVIVEVLRPAHEHRFVQTLMTRTGMHGYYINDFVLEPSTDGSFSYRAPEYNWLFCRQTPRELADQVRGSGLSVRL